VATFCHGVNTKGVQRYWYIDRSFPLEAHKFVRQLLFWPSIKSYRTSAVGGLASASSWKTTRVFLELIYFWS